MAEEKERLNWDLQLMRRSLDRISRENEVLAFELQLAGGVGDEPSSSSSSSSMFSSSSSGGVTRLDGHPADDASSRASTAKMAGAMPHLPGN